jgi:hypothetical protein
MSFSSVVRDGQLYIVSSDTFYCCDYMLSDSDFYNLSQTFYVDEALRITRDLDENFFVFVRES